MKRKIVLEFTLVHTWCLVWCKSRICARLCIRRCVSKIRGRLLIIERLQHVFIWVYAETTLQEECV